MISCFGSDLVLSFFILKIGPGIVDGLKLKVPYDLHTADLATNKLKKINELKITSKCF